MTEYFDVVDENDNIIGKATRKECHSGSMLLHRGAIIFIVNSKGELLLQKRSMKKDLFKGFWTGSATGHVDSGEKYEQAAERELKEELGLSLPIKFIAKFITEMGVEREMHSLFIANFNGNINEIKFPEDEIEKIEFRNIEKIKKDIKEKEREYTPDFLKSFQKYYDGKNQYK